MRTLKKQLKHNLALFLFSSLLSAIPAMAASDLEAQQGFARARAKSLHKDADHTAHENHPDKSQEFHGVFYGYLPCNDCAGVKTTLSLQQKNNYLLVTQPAKESSREFYERGKYNWDDENRTVVLTPKKEGTNSRRYQIADEGTLIQLNDDGIKLDDYVLQRSDTVKSREVHIH
ncbi:copper resistance protein NlpE [Methylomicrobium sp. Wu6]|uniref:copper resistance protein NlpE n=1 Tax=Methylomicrobium sp. Wu6 TaxID=3107928 RepID=UPI002DD61D2A|nr:copper resistance protein NlpE [Methylomicrobium sp. Wu6]MEC4750629.1 copper resistance protein NlpE [Methylomicrobium sp. Wu6]